MAEQRGDPLPELAPDAVPAPSAWSAGALVDYVEEHLDTYTPDALETALVTAGHDVADVRMVIGRAQARRASGPVKARAQAIVMALYGLTYAVFVVGLLGVNLPYGGSVIAAVVLTVVMAVAFGVSLLFLRRKGAPISVLPLIAVPLVFLVLIGGACYMTTGAPLEYFRGLLDGSGAIVDPGN